MDTDDYKDNPIEKSNPTNKPRSTVRDLFEWKSLNRPIWAYSKETFRTLGAIALLISIILLFFQEWLAIVVTWAALFLFYMLTKLPPVEVIHKITTQGIVSMDKSYLWDDLGPFWFTKKGDDNILHVATRNIYGQLIILVHEKDIPEIRETLAEYLPYIESVEKSPIEKMQESFSKKFPLEKVVPKNFTLHNEEPPKSPGAPGQS